MIYYNTECLFGILFRWHGSALNGPGPKRAIIMALFALLIAYLNDQYNFVVPTRESTAFVDTLTVFNTFLGLIMSFRMNSAFQQWRSGVVAISQVSEVARGIVSSGCAFVNAQPVKQRKIVKKKRDQAFESDESNDNAEEETKNKKKTKRSVSSSAVPPDVLEKCTFFIELRRLVFLYIAIVFHDCRGRDGIEKMKDSAILSPSEYDELFACGSEATKKIKNKESFSAVVRKTPHKLRATVVELWLRRLVEVASQRGHMTPPNAGQMHAKISQLPALYTTVFNIANVPIPFNYMQYLQFLICAYMTLYTFVIVPRSGFYTPLWVFLWGLFLFTADQVAMEIECPFGLDANDIDLESRLLQIEEELTVLIRSQYYFVSGGCDFSKVPLDTNSASSWRVTTPNAAEERVLGHGLSFHQGRVPSSPNTLESTKSLPEINEYTALIVRKSEEYGSSSGND
jgi:putative membrane protein